MAATHYQCYNFTVINEIDSCLDTFLGDGFTENIVERRPEMERWTLEWNLCQFDYILLSRALARTNVQAVPDIVRRGQHLHTIFLRVAEGETLSARRLGSA